MPESLPALHRLYRAVFVIGLTGKIVPDFSNFGDFEASDVLHGIFLRFGKSKKADFLRF